MKVLRLYFALSLCIIPQLARSQVSKVEKKIIAAVDRHNQEALALLKQTVNINSGTMNLQGIQEVGKVYREKLEALGLETQWVPGEAFQRAGHLVAVHRGNGKGPKLLLIGHLDTVFERDSPFQRYTMLNDSVMLGPGVVDMKGGDIIIIYALQALKEAGVLKNMDIEVVMTGDEEKSGSPLHLSKQALVEAAKGADIAIGFENGDSDPATAVVSRRGSTGWELKVTGNAAHSSQIFSDKVGAGAIYEASRILNAFYEGLTDEQYLTFNPGVMLAGTSVEYDKSQDGGSAFGKSNVVAKEAMVQGDIRAVSQEQLERAKSVMLEIVSAHRPKTSAELVFKEDGYPPLPPSEGNHQLLSLYSQVSQDLGYGPVGAVKPINAGAADVSFTSGLVNKAIDGLGLSGGKDHTVDEYGHIYMLPALTKRAAVFLYRLAYEK